MARVLFNWTTERVERARQMWFAGASSSQIAHAIGAWSRNVVIGKLHRLGLTGYQHPDRPKPSTRNKRALPRTISEEEAERRRQHRQTQERKRQAMRIGSYGRPTIVEHREFVPAVPADEPAPLNLTIYELNGRTCKWAVTAELPHLFCGHQTYDSSWCPHHARRVNVPFRKPIEVTEADRHRRRIQTQKGLLRLPDTVLLSIDATDVSI